MTTVPMIMAEVVVAIVVVRTAIDMGKVNICGTHFFWDEHP